MALSCYLGFGRKPGFNGNSVYLTTVEDLDDSVATVGEIEQLDGGPIISATEVAAVPIMDDAAIRSMDRSKISVSNDSNTFIPTLAMSNTDEISSKLIIQDNKIINDAPKGRIVASVYATPTLNNSCGIIDGNSQNNDEELKKFMHKKQMDTLTGAVNDNCTNELTPSQQIQTESAYIGMPNLFNCTNIEKQKYHYALRSPKIEKYVIEKPMVENDEEQKILKAKIQQLCTDNNNRTCDNVSNTYTTMCSYDITTVESEYAFNVEEYGNVTEQFLHSNESKKMESKTKILANKEQFPNSEICKAETETDKDSSTISTMIAPEKHYIQSFYNANDLDEWNVY